MTPVEWLFAAVSFLLIAIAIGLLLPSSILFIECMAALFPSRTISRPGSTRLTVNILVPAHNEESGIEATIRNLIPQLQTSDRLIVVADNCHDDTAAVARAAGATVIERHDLTQRGKGYALDFGVKAMAHEPPDVVVIVDADCLVAPGSVAQLAQVAVVRHRPVQAIYLLETPAQLSAKNAVSTLAFWVKNWVRLTGLYNLGMPCLLTGTGMAMPWDVIQRAPLASGNIVEDMNLGMDLAIAGYSPIFCPQARVTSVLPQKAQAAKSQRTRWEHGHLQTIATQVPRLLTASIQQARLDLCVLALDLLVPPLSLLVMLWLIALVAALGSAALGGSLVPVVLLGIAGAFIAIAILSAWAKYCRKELPAQVLLTIPLYILWKIPLYFAFLFKRQKAWVRTERDVMTDSSKAKH